MKKTILSAALVLFGFAQHSSAQETIDNTTDKKYSHYMAIQANPLFRQILSFGGAPAVNNPYLLKYSLKSNDIPWELNVGMGYEYLNTEAQSAGSSDISELFSRIGVAHKKMLGKRFEYGLGLDFAFNLVDNYTVNVSTSDIFNGNVVDSTITETRTNELGFGGGIQFNFAYYINQHILLGTEATYYYIHSNEKMNVETRRYVTSGGGGFIPQTTNVLTSNSNEEASTGQMNLNLPVALYLVIKF